MVSQFPWRFQPHRHHHFAQGFQSLALEPGNPLGLVLDYQALLPPVDLRGDACRAFAGVAFHRLHATQREHEGAGGIAPVRPQCDRAGHASA